MASDFDGDFVVVWQSDGSAGTDSSDTSIQGQRYASDGSPAAGQFQVNSYTTSSQSHPAVAAGAAGGFAVTWHSLGSFGSDGDAASVQGQRYAADGTPSGGEFQVNAFTTDVQRRSELAADANGDFLVAWESRGSFESDDSDYSIQGQRYLPEPDARLGLAACLLLLAAFDRRRARATRRASRTPTRAGSRSAAR